MNSFKLTATFVRLMLPVALLGSVSHSALAQSWSTTGNAGTAPPTNFIGTTDNEPLEIHLNNAGVNGGGVMRFEPNFCNAVDCGFNLIGGKLGIDGNSVLAGVVGATIFGGGENFDFAILSNVAGGDFATISGGGANTASGGADVIAGGLFNATNGGALDPEISNGGATVGGGESNSATAAFATVPGGNENTASGASSFAAGTVANAKDHGSFVWSDDTSFLQFSSAAADTFNVRAQGGVRFISAINPTTGVATSGVKLPHGSGSWQSLSDRNAKSNFKRVDGVAVLRELSKIPVETWNYKAQEPTIRHIGPMAQDFSAAFKVGEDNTHITEIDAEGVALAAIQGLYALVKEKNQQLAALQAQVDAEVTQLGAMRVSMEAMDRELRAETGHPVVAGCRPIELSGRGVRD